MGLADNKCVPCRGGVPPMERAKAEGMLKQLARGWSLNKEGHLERLYTFKDFAQALDFVNKVGAVAEAVEVVGNASKVDTQTPTLKEVVDERRIRELPLNGRDATQLVLLLPGVYGTTDTSGLRQGGSARSIVQPGVSSNGGRGKPDCR